MRSVVTEESTPLLLKVGIAVLIGAVVLMGVMMYLNSNNSSKIQDERDRLKRENIDLQQQYDALSDSILYYDKNQKLLEKQIVDRNIRIEILRSHFKTIRQEYDKEITDIRSDSTVASFRAITDIFRQHDSNSY